MPSRTCDPYELMEGGEGYQHWSWRESGGGDGCRWVVLWLALGALLDCGVKVWVYEYATFDPLDDVFAPVSSDLRTCTSSKMTILGTCTSLPT